MIKQIFQFLLIIKASTAFALLQPAEHSVLNHTTIYFEEDLKRNCDHVELVLLADSLYEGQKPVHTLTSRMPCFWVTDLGWGKEYFWRVKYYDAAGKQISISPLHHFFVQDIRYPNMEQMRLRVVKNDTNRHQGGLIAVDYTRSVFDREGNVVWTIPVKDSLMDGKVQIRDLRMTHENTFTFLTGKAPMEIDFDGKILWKAPYPLVLKGDTVIYHHDFQKTNKGTYMVMGLKKVYRRMIGSFSEEQLKTADIRKIGNDLYQGTQMNMLLEFDKTGKLIWTWDASKYISDEELNYKKTVTGLPNFATHANAFAQSEDGSIVYIGFRDLSRIVKIDKASGKFLRAYGEPYPGTGENFVESNFRKQHGSFLTDHQTILLFNNNNRGPGEQTVSSVMELDNRPKITEPSLLWEFKLDFDSLSGGKGVSGGNVIELKDQNVFVCAGTLNRIFEVTRMKEVVWDAFVEARRAGEVWQPAPQYRASFKQKFMWHKAKVVLADVQGAKVLQIQNTGTEDEDIEMTVKKGEPAKSISLTPGFFYQETLPANYNLQDLSLRLISTQQALPINTIKN